MTIRPITSADEPLLYSWWIGHGKALIPADLWPKNGFIVNECVAGFLLCTDGGVAYLEWIVSSPDYDSIIRREALKELFAALGGRAIQLGYKMAGLLTEKASLIALLKEDGFQVDSNRLTSLYRRLY